MLSALVDRAGIDPELIDDVVLGCANQAGEDNRNVARMAALLADLPIEVPGQTVNRLCASSWQAVTTAAYQISAGGAHCIVAGGVESMSRAPLVLAREGLTQARGSRVLEDTALGWRLVNPRMPALHGVDPLGETAEKVAERCGASRERQDDFALRSHVRASAAQANGVFEGEIVPIEVDGADPVTEDEGPRPNSSLEALGQLRPVFRESGTVTAGNASPLSDGAAMLLMCSLAEAERRGLEPLARFVAAAAAGVEPSLMGLGPVPATKRLLAQRPDFEIDAFGLVEINEAFAAQSVACSDQLGLQPDRVNVNGGAIALGHRLGPAERG